MSTPPRKAADPSPGNDPSREDRRRQRAPTDTAHRVRIFLVPLPLLSLHMSVFGSRSSFRRHSTAAWVGPALKTLGVLAASAMSHPTLSRRRRRKGSTSSAVLLSIIAAGGVAWYLSSRERDRSQPSSRRRSKFTDNGREEHNTASSASEDVLDV